MLPGTICRSVSGLSGAQKEMLTTALVQSLHLDLEQCQVRPSECPRCHSDTAAFIRRGTCGTAQRYACSACHHRFVFHPSEVMRGSHLPVQCWIRQMEDLLEGVSIERSSLETGLSTRTIQRVRNCLLTQIDHLILEGVLEPDSDPTVPAAI